MEPRKTGLLCCWGALGVAWLLPSRVHGAELQVGGHIRLREAVHIQLVYEAGKIRVDSGAADTQEALILKACDARGCLVEMGQPDATLLQPKSYSEKQWISFRVSYL